MRLGEWLKRMTQDHPTDHLMGFLRESVQMVSTTINKYVRQAVDQLECDLVPVSTKMFWHVPLSRRIQCIRDGRPVRVGRLVTTHAPDGSDDDSVSGVRYMKEYQQLMVRQHIMDLARKHRVRAEVVRVWWDELFPEKQMTVDAPEPSEQQRFDPRAMQQEHGVPTTDPVFGQLVLSSDGVLYVPLPAYIPGRNTSFGMCVSTLDGLRTRVLSQNQMRSYTITSTGQPLDRPACTSTACLQSILYGDDIRAIQRARCDARVLHHLSGLVLSNTRNGTTGIPVIPDGSVRQCILVDLKGINEVPMLDGEWCLPDGSPFALIVYTTHLRLLGAWHSLFDPSLPDRVRSTQDKHGMEETHRLYGRMLVHTRDGYLPGPYFVLPPDRKFNGGIGHRLIDAYIGFAP
jgi:hypothetical protein